MPIRVKKLVFKELDKNNIANIESIPLIQVPDSFDWGVINGRSIACSCDLAKTLEKALEDKELLVKQCNDYEIQSICLTNKQELLYEMQKKIKACDIVIAFSIYALKHEIKHYIKEDLKHEMYVVGILPILIQLGYSGFVYSFNKMLNIKPPTRWYSTLFRSSLSVASMKPKMMLNFIGIALYNQHQEREADRFACEHAENRLELQVAYDYHKNTQISYEEDLLKKMPKLSAQSELLKEKIIRLFYFFEDEQHPYYADRAAMVKKYLNKWDAEHKN
jgi:hypothetical protein